MKALITRKPEVRAPARRIDPFDLMVEDFFQPFSLLRRDWPLARLDEMTMPRVDVTETEKEIKVSAEIPGVDEKDVKVELEENALILSGEKKEEHEEKTRHGYRMERRFGSFHRVIPLPTRVESEKAKAEFRKGVLTVTVPKMEEARKRIDIKVG